LRTLLLGEVQECPLVWQQVLLVWLRVGPCGRIFILRHKRHEQCEQDEGGNGFHGESAAILDRQSADRKPSLPRIRVPDFRLNPQSSRYFANFPLELLNQRVFCSCEHCSKS
jgi:hypothetical protein